MEKWPSGRRRSPAKGVHGLSRVESSNLSFSAIHIKKPTMNVFLVGFFICITKNKNTFEPTTAKIKNNPFKRYSLDLLFLNKQNTPPLQLSNDLRAGSSVG